MSQDAYNNTVSGEQKHENVSSSELLSLVAHELRTPLSVTKWYTEMLLDRDAGELTVDQEKYLRTIQISNQRSIDLVRSLLNVSRLDLGTFSVNPVETDIRFLIKQVITENQTLLTKKKVKVEEMYESFISGVIPSIVVDKQLCLIIFRALISNAIFYSRDESSVLVKVCEIGKGQELDSKILGKDSLVFSVKDSGIGIPELEKKNIFNRFFRASNIVDDETKGAGLSLSIVKDIITKVGGDIWFTSEEGVGSTFYIAFPKEGMTRIEGKASLD